MGQEDGKIAALVMGLAAGLRIRPASRIPVCLLLAELARRHGIFLAEGLNEDTGVVEAAVIGDLRDRMVSRDQHPARMDHTDLAQIGGKIHAQGSLEKPRQIADGKMDLVRQGRQRQILIPVAVNVFDKGCRLFPCRRPGPPRTGAAGIAGAARKILQLLQEPDQGSPGGEGHGVFVLQIFIEKTCAELPDLPEDRLDPLPVPDITGTVQAFFSAGQPQGLLRHHQL